MSMILHYTNDDDGVHLRCQCGADIVLDYESTVQDAVKIETEHFIICGLQPNNQ